MAEGDDVKDITVEIGSKSRSSLFLRKIDLV